MDKKLVDRVMELVFAVETNLEPLPKGTAQVVYIRSVRLEYERAKRHVANAIILGTLSQADVQEFEDLCRNFVVSHWR